MTTARTSLRTSFVWTLFGNTFYLACQWLIVVIIAKLGSQEMVGQFSLALAVVAPIATLSGLALRVVQANDAKGERPFATYAGLRVTTTTLALLVIAGIALSGGYSDETAMLIPLLGIAKASELLSEVIWGQLQRHEQMVAISRSMIVKGVLSTVAFTVALVATHNLPVATAAMACAWIATLVGYDVPTARRLIPGELRPSFDRAALVRLAWLALPLGIVMMVISLASNVPRYFLAAHWGEAEVGVFGAIANLMIVGMSVMMALGQVLAPRLSRAYVAGNRAEVMRSLRLLAQVALVLGAGGIVIAELFGAPLLSIIYTREYASAAPVLVCVMCAALVGNFLSIFGFVLNAAGMFRPQVPLQVMNLTAVLAVAWWLVPTHGAFGAAVAILVGYCVTAIAGGAVAVYCVRRLP